MTQQQRRQEHTMRTAFAPDLFNCAPSRAQLYKEEAVIGNGAYGTVYKAKDINDPTRYVALKKVRIPVNEDGVPVSILREISLVRQLDRFRHPNVVRFLDVCHGPRVGAEQNLTLFLVFEFVEKDLAKYIREAKPDDLSPAKVKDIMFQLLCGVDFLHSQRIVHRDLKPQNLLISRTGQVKIADFGLAKVYDFTMRLTSVVVTLWYRSPEVLLGCTYATPIDMWSVGCIFAELIKRRPLFPGATERDQLEKIFDIIGTPKDEQWPAESRVLPINFSPRMARNLEVVFPELDEKGISLLEKMFTFKPLERINARDALLHPYFDGRAIPPVLLSVPPARVMLPVRSPNPFSVSSVLNTSTTSTTSSLNSSISADDSGYGSMISQ
ncbi:cyclin-dependent kinase 4 [Folsomia candida]|nr:cyclin-dependent kinase 4 [Folsomia candida]XP_035707345.1 cyclin-dependent kinase 4 [Folsomia candida]XP_035707346.1 cyclin-dependent kinase 4 [Folsomia candida]XP_035707347.1 cyclin-dependent kinase 4 [Folsomia candida]XP_035707348.1 cyclin-dependent kinase 4 [Folsomia candida]